MKKSHGNLLYFEFSPVGIAKKSRLRVETGIITQFGLLYAGDAVLRKLPGNIRSGLNLPVSCDLIEGFVWGDNPLDVTPERARAALMVAEVLLAMEELVKRGQKLTKKSGPPPYQLAVNKKNGSVFFGATVFFAREIISRAGFSLRAAGVKPRVVKEMWLAILEILREDLVALPGARQIKKRKKKS